MREISVGHGKYTFRVPEGDWRVHVLRHGEPWLVIEAGHNAVSALMAEFDQAVERVAERTRNALRAVLLFHGGGDWSEERRTEWRKLVGCEEATTRALCDFVRLSLGQTIRAISDGEGGYKCLLCEVTPEKGAFWSTMRSMIEEHQQAEHPGELEALVKGGAIAAPWG